MISDYDMNATIMMSSLVFIDLEECIELLTELLYIKPQPKPKPIPSIFFEIFIYLFN